MTQLSAQPGALVFSGGFAILASHPVRGVASGRVALSAAAQASFSSPVVATQFTVPTVKSSLSVGRKGFKQVR
jgi:hypothetical protein